MEGRSELRMQNIVHASEPFQKSIGYLSEPWFRASDPQSEPKSGNIELRARGRT